MKPPKIPLKGRWASRILWIGLPAFALALGLALAYYYTDPNRFYAEATIHSVMPPGTPEEWRIFSADPEEFQNLTYRMLENFAEEYIARGSPAVHLKLTRLPGNFCKIGVFAEDYESAEIFANFISSQWVYACQQRKIQLLASPGDSPRIDYSSPVLEALRGAEMRLVSLQLAKGIEDKAMEAEEGEVLPTPGRTTEDDLNGYLAEKAEYLREMAPARELRRKLKLQAAALEASRKEEWQCSMAWVDHEFETSEVMKEASRVSPILPEHPWRDGKQWLMLKYEKTRYRAESWIKSLRLR